MPGPSLRFVLPFAALIAGCHEDASTTAGADPWARRFGNNADQNVIHLAAGPNGELAITGSFSSGIDLGGGVFGTAPDDTDLFVGVLSPEGEARWSGSTGGTGPQTGLSATFDRLGRAVYTGAFTEQIDFGGGPFKALDIDTYVAAFEPDGTLAWAKHFSADDGGPTGAGSSYPARIVAGGDGNLVIAGHYDGTFGLGGPPLEGDLTRSQPSAFVGKLDPEGGHVFTVGFGGNNHTAAAVASDAAGNVVVVGMHAGTMSLGDTTLGAESKANAFLARLAPDGTPLWLQHLGGPAVSEATAVAIDAAGDIYVGGCFEGMLDTSGGVVPSSGLGGRDGFVMALVPGGDLRWISVLPGACVADLAVDPAGHVHAAGDYHDAPDLGTGPLPYSVHAFAFVVELDGAGRTVSARSFGTSGNTSTITNLALVDGGLVVAGSFYSTLDLDPPIQSAGGVDLFVARLR